MDKAGNVERKSKGKKQNKTKQTPLHHSALIGCGMKGVEIGPMDLSSSMRGLPNPLHEIRQRYVSKGRLEGS